MVNNTTYRHSDRHTNKAVHCDLVVCQRRDVGLIFVCLLST